MNTKITGYKGHHTQNKYVWWEKTVEYLFLKQNINYNATQPSTISVSPLGGTAEEIGDAIFQDKARFTIIEFKREQADCTAEYKKFFNTEIYSYQKSIFSASKGLIFKSVSQIGLFILEMINHLTTNTSLRTSSALSTKQKQELKNIAINTHKAPCQSKLTIDLLDPKYVFFVLLYLFGDTKITMLDADEPIFFSNPEESLKNITNINPTNIIQYIKAFPRVQSLITSYEYIKSVKELFSYDNSIITIPNHTELNTPIVYELLKDLIYSLLPSKPFNRNIVEKDIHHYLVYGEMDVNHNLALKAQSYFSNTPINSPHKLLNGCSLYEFNKYILFLKTFKKHRQK